MLTNLFWLRKTNKTTDVKIRSDMTKRLVVLFLFTLCTDLRSAPKSKRGISISVFYLQAANRVFSR